MGTAKYYLFLEAVEAASFLVLAVLCLRGSPLWRLAGVGAGLAAAVAVLYTVAEWELVYQNSTWLAQKLYRHHLDDIVRALRAAGLVVLVAGFALAQRQSGRQPGRPAATYGD